MGLNWLFRKKAEKKISLMKVNEAREQLVEVELDLQRLRDKWKSFERLAMAARGKERSSQIDHDGAVQDFWHWVNLSNNKKVLEDVISGKTDSHEQHRMKY